MRLFCMFVSLIVAVQLSLCAQIANAEIIDGQNWADSVVSHTDKIQNYGGDFMDPTTEWWVTGKSDADVNGNGYAWDEGIDQDYVAGWRANAPGENITVGFNTGLADMAGNDLAVHMYGGPNAIASVLGSVDGVFYTQIGSIGSGTPGYFRDEEFDFDGKFSGDVQYIKVLREANGANTGMFFDSFASAPASVIPEPMTLVLLASGGLLMIGRWLVTRRRAA